METQSLNGRQSKAIASLLEADTVAEAAETSGIARSTIYSWMNSPRFRSELERARRAEHEARLNKLRKMLPKALDALEGLLESEDERVRLRAASEIVKACQALGGKEPAGMSAIELFEASPDEASLPKIAFMCLEGLLDGSLDAKAAYMAPQYMAMLERVGEKEAEKRRARKREAENERMILSILEDHLAKDPEHREKVERVGAERAEQEAAGENGGESM